YGAVQLTSVTSNGQISAFVFSAWCSPAAPRDSNPASGSALVGGTFCIPFLSVGSGQTQTIRRVLTNVAAAASVQITDGKRSFLDTVMVPAGCSYLWDSAALG